MHLFFYNKYINLHNQKKIFKLTFYCLLPVTPYSKWKFLEGRDFGCFVCISGA